MLRLLTFIGTFLSLLTGIATRSETDSSMKDAASGRWSAAVKTHNQFDNWT